MKTKKCKYCQSEIDNKAKICPNCKKRQGVSPILAVFLIIILVPIVYNVAMEVSGGRDYVDSNLPSSSTDDSSSTSNQPFSYTVDKAYNDGYWYYIEGSVTNNKNKDYNYVQIEVICYDKSGNNLGTALGNTNSLLGNQTWKYKALFMGSNTKEVDHCDYHDITSW